MNKTMSMGLNQCLTKYPCSGHVKQKSLTLKINELGFFLPKSPPAVSTTCQRKSWLYSLIYSWKWLREHLREGCLKLHVFFIDWMVEAELVGVQA